MKEIKEGDVYGCMGCRSFLTPDRFTKTKGNIANALNYKEDMHKYWGRFNQGVVTINLPDVACTAAGDMDGFWKVFDERLELCHKGLRVRHLRLLGTPSDAAPILWQYGALARLDKKNPLISCYTMVIPRCHLDMRAFMNVYSGCYTRAIQIRRL